MARIQVMGIEEKKWMREGETKIKIDCAADKIIKLISIFFCFVFGKRPKENKKTKTTQKKKDVGEFTSRLSPRFFFPPLQNIGNKTPP